MIKIKHRPDNLRRVLIAWFLLAALQGVFTANLILASPSASEAVLWGLSPARLALLAGVGITTLLLAWTGGLMWRGLQPLTSRLENRLKSLTAGRGWKWVSLICVAGLLLNAYLIVLTPAISEPYTRAVLERMAPLFYWLSGLCAETMILLSLTPPVGNSIRHQLKNPIVRGALILWSLFIAIWIWIAWSRIGLEVDPRGWNVLGAPVTEIHVLLAWLVGIGFLAVGLRSKRWQRISPQTRLDLTLFILLWIGAAYYWNSVPLPASWFVTGPTAPNQEYYPNSDALIYDTTGQSVLVGERYKSWDQPYPRRPIYAMFLAGLRALTGQDYQVTGYLQAGILAFIPALIYLLGKNLDNRLAGLIAAVLIILREGSGIAISGSATISHSRLLMSDFPNALGVLLFTLLVVYWSRDPANKRRYALLGGVVLGLFMLNRPETGILAVGFGIIAFLILINRFKALMTGLALFGLGAVLVLSPWIWRNYQLGGSLFLERPDNRINFILDRFQRPVNRPTPTPPPDSSGFFEGGIEKGVEASSWAQYVSASISQVDNHLTAGVPDDLLSPQEEPENQDLVGPASFLHTVGTHFTNSLIQFALMLPDANRIPEAAITFTGHQDLSRLYNECCTTINYVRRLPFWFDPELEGFDYPPQVSIPLLVNLFIVAVGLSKCWSRERWRGWIPLLFAFLFISILALARTSGGRYILSVDWVVLLYFSIGLSQLTLWFLTALTGIVAPAGWLGASAGENKEYRPKRRKIISIAAFLLLIIAALALPLSESWIRSHYPQQRKELMVNEVLSEQVNANPLSLKREIIADFEESGGLILAGRALYPRFYPAHEGAPGKPGTDTWAGMAKPSFYSQVFSRMSFYLVGPRNLSVLIRMGNSPDFFPHTANVVVFGCPTEAFLDARAVGLFDDSNRLEAVYTWDGDGLFTCSPTP